MIGQTFTRNELSELTGTSVEAIKNIAHELIPMTWRDQGRYAPLTVVLLVFLRELHGKFGVRSAIPRKVAGQVIPQLEAAWHQRANARCLIKMNGMELAIPKVRALDEARELLEAVA